MVCAISELYSRYTHHATSTRIPSNVGTVYKYFDFIAALATLTSTRIPSNVGTVYKYFDFIAALATLTKHAT